MIFLLWELLVTFVVYSAVWTKLGFVNLLFNFCKIKIIILMQQSMLDFCPKNKNVDGLCIYLFIYSLNSATCREKEHTMSELSINFNSMKQQLWAHYIKILVHIPFKKAALIVWAKKCMVHWIEPNTLFRHTVWGVWANMKIDCLHTFFTWSRSKGGT